MTRKTNPQLTWFGRLRRAPAKWNRRTWSERRLLLEAFVLLGLARLLVLAVPFRWLARTLGEPLRESAPEARPEDLLGALRIAQAVRSAAGNTPWRSVCLPQAVAGQWMLKRRGIAATLYLGAARAEGKPGGLAAHAWLRCGNAILTGGPGHEAFTRVASFSPPPQED